MRAAHGEDRDAVRPTRVMTFGLVLLFLLSSLAWFSATAVAVRLRPAGRAELLIATSLIWNGLVVLPVYVLGYLNLLTTSRLAISALALFVAVYFGSCFRRDFRAHARSTTNAIASMFALPVDAIREAYKSRSIVLIGVCVTFGAIAWSAVVTYLAPSEGWDGLLYHEAMVGFAIQNRGFRIVDMPPILQYHHINGYPRLCEMTSAWLVMFADRRLIELPNTLLSPTLVAATYAIARRYTFDRVVALGWGCVILLIPHMLWQLRTTYMDIHVAAILLSAMYFATRPRMRMRDAWMSAFALSLLLAAKGMAIVWTPVLALVAVTRLVNQHRARRVRDLIFTIAGGTMLILAGAVTYFRNWIVFHNPLWPIGYSNPRLHIEWRGMALVDEAIPELAWPDLVKRIYGLPVAGWLDVMERGYGYAVPWVVIPLALVAMVVMLVAGIRELVLRRELGNISNLLWVSILGFVSLKTSPALWIARYNIQIVAMLVFFVAWLGGRPRWHRFGEGAVAAAIALSIMAMTWPGFFMGVSDATLGRLLHSGPATRATIPTMGWGMPEAVMAARERELGDGDLLVFTDDVNFPALLWNERFSNRIEYVPFTDAAGFLAKLDALHAKWVVVRPGYPSSNAVLSKPAAWAEVGDATLGYVTKAYRRVER
jgi:hypothetical protein